MFGIILTIFTSWKDTLWFLQTSMLTKVPKEPTSEFLEMYVFKSPKHTQNVFLNDGSIIATKVSQTAYQIKNVA